MRAFQWASSGLALILVITLSPVAPAQDFIRGDTNGDGVVDIADGVYTLRAAFVPGTAIPCFDAMDVDDNGVFNGLLDGLFLLSYISLPGSPSVPAPFPFCGFDPTADALDCITYDCFPPAPPGPDPAYVLSISDVIGMVGAEADVSCSLDSSAGDILDGYSFGVCQDSDVIQIVEVELGAATQAVGGGDGPDFNAVALEPTEGWTVAVVIDLIAQSGLPAAADQELHVATYFLQDQAAVQLDYCDTIGDPAVSVVVVVEGASVTPETLGGTVFSGGMPDSEYRRGDADADGSFSGIVDGVFLLSFQFVPGSPAPPCFDAADVDDDGSFNGLVDGLFALNFGFVPGSPPPPPPGAFDCGVDPTDDGLECEQYDFCP